jgi:hypothetical protein
MIDGERMGLDIDLLSRWQKTDEIDRMKQAVEQLSRVVRKRIAAIWCDSCAYRLMVSVDDRQTALLIAALCPKRRVKSRTWTSFEGYCGGLKSAWREHRQLIDRPLR